MSQIQPAAVDDGGQGGGIVPLELPEDATPMLSSAAIGVLCDIYEARTRGSRTRFRMSMMKFATITQTANTSRRPWVSG